MANNYTVPDKFDPRKGYTGVHWGEQSKVLEVELTEMQRILKQQTYEAVRAFICDGFVNALAMDHSGGTLTVPADTIFANGAAINLTTNLTLAVSAYPTTVYLAVWEADVDSTSTVNTDGNQSSGTATLVNDMIDTRLNIDTSHRLQRQVQLVTSNTDNTKYYLPVVTVTAAGVVTDNRIKAQTIRPIDWSLVVGEPTTLSGYGITDGVTPVAAQTTADNTRKDAAKTFVLEVRTTDPATPAVGQMWFRSDL